ncbi:acyl-CoA thioester hydrolase/BAAT C-terminal domain-containing protein [Duganella violaceipulchra]|uniref:Dienelactone hydrolase n=1 Tax=Duganella violaceipulchra TaxID=2849652 RepID=A0AA41LAZ8_9BURK|nr:acyl-CoA thioester hydrolase/BAAT C-terminal domain-containing protein [Duganella violaceicalia]MBV6324790.1 dienelactone hydrolase family protein [Duganella violaceicalia]MCP2009113.1 dienelactone hydrolase [Duganella violaceicalia]
MRQVVYRDLVAHLYLPKTAAKVPVVVAIGGSEGGLGTGDANGQMMAPHGIAVLGLAYFSASGLPATLDQIPLEYFIRALDFLQTQPEVDATRIGFVGGSRGAEAALLVASIDQRIKSVVVTTPSSVAWFGRTLPKSAWTWQGKDVPAMSPTQDQALPQVGRFLAALDQQQVVRQARIAVEKINGPILLISAQNDQIWPSFQMSNDIAAELKAQHYPHAVTHDSYPTGHGFSQELAPHIKQSIIDHFLHTL